MPSEQEFCLRWNDHKSTLITIFESLLESNILVDCTLAAEGQCLKAHKVVLSACSPYFQFLLTQHTDKHPIVILKDVKFEQLRAMIDYMYRGEVNIPEDQLGPLLKAAESLQIRGLGGASIRDKHVDAVKNTSSQPFVPEKHSHSPKREMVDNSPSKGTNGPVRNVQASVRKGSLSPVPRKRSCPSHISNSENESPSAKVEQQLSQAPPLTNMSSVQSSVPSSSNQSATSCRTAQWTDMDSERPPLLVSSSDKDVPPLASLSSFGRSLEETSGSPSWCELGLKTSPSPSEPHIGSGGLSTQSQNEDRLSQVLLVPKTEYVELDDDSLTNAVLDEVQDLEAGPSQGDGDPSASGFVPWLQNIEGMTHTLVSQEAPSSFQTSQVCETSQTMLRGRKGAQGRRNMGNTTSQNPYRPAREYKRLRTLRRMKKEAMTEEEIEELRRYERERKRVQRAKKAALAKAALPMPSTSLWAPPFSWQ